MSMNKIKVLARTAAISGALSLFGAGAALAADASIDNTGPDSSNTINQSSSNTINQNNSNEVKVVNVNHQNASSGDATVKNNTNAGSASSGNASNNNSVSTSVSINNESAGSGGGGGGAGSPGVGSGSGAGPGSGAGAGSGSSAGLGGSSSLGSAAAGLGGEVGVLPETGCNPACDVSALRNALKDPLNGTSGNQALALALAALLSLAGAAGSAVYAARRQS